MRKTVPPGRRARLKVANASSPAAVHSQAMSRSGAAPRSLIPATSGSLVMLAPHHREDAPARQAGRAGARISPESRCSVRLAVARHGVNRERHPMSVWTGPALCGAAAGLAMLLGQPGAAAERSVGLQDQTAVAVTIY